jgi:stearoyl-CoA desaturase (delta-9 desaturase)
MNFLWMAAVTLLILQLSAFCTTIYLHRCKTHKALELHPVVGLLMHLHLCLFTGVIPRQWVAVHRKHHHFSDKPGDPHSPYLYGLWTVLFGNYFLYKKEAGNPEVTRKYTPDWNDDVLDKIPHLQWAAFGGLGIFMLLFGIGWGAVAWVTHVVVYVLANATINSVCHMIGYRNFENEATNLQWVAWFTAGEGLHNNHHEHPTSARFSVRHREKDPAWPVIWLLARLRLAKVKPLPMAKATSSSIAA